MPIKIPNDLPARPVLEAEGVQIISEADAIRQDVRPLRIALLNLMPEKEKTETQLARLIGSTPLQVEMTLLTTGSYQSKNASKQHMIDFYKPWAEVRDQYFDGLIVTGAPVELMEFDEVIYWRELRDMYDWTRHHVVQTLNICWGAQAALNHFHGVPKATLPQKMFGVYLHRRTKSGSALLRGFDDLFAVPVSRYTEVRFEDIKDIPDIDVLAMSEQAGLCLLQDRRYRQTYMFNHLEYDSHTLRDEFERDRKAGKNTQIPAGYFPDDDPSLNPKNRWRAFAHLLFGNWINEIYQQTPYDLQDLKTWESPARKAG